MQLALHAHLAFASVPLKYGKNYACQEQVGFPAWQVVFQLNEMTSPVQAKYESCFMQRET